MPLSLRMLLCSGAIFISAIGSLASGDIQQIRIFDAAGLFRAQGVIVESVPAVTATSILPSSEAASNKREAGARIPAIGATVEVLLEQMPVEGLRLSPVDSIGEPLTAQMVGERDGKLMFHFSGVQSGSWELNAPSEALLEVRVLNNPPPATQTPPH